jgi:hypothetical protein
VALRPRRTRRRAVSDPLTRLLALAAVVSTGGVIGGEVLRVWRRGDAPLPSETSDVVGAAGTATRQTVEVAVEGYRSGTLRENALFNMLLSFNVAWATARVSAYVIRRRGTFGPFRPLKVQRRHIHHFVPGIVLAFVAGGASVISRDENLDTLLAIPFGAGVALTLDESALLLRLDDVYWTEEGIVSVQITLAALLMLSALAVAVRMLRRGEQEVLGA